MFCGALVAPKFEEAKCDRRTDGQTDDGQSDPYVALCFPWAPPPQEGKVYRSPFCPPPFAKAGDIKSHSSVRPSLRPSVPLSVTKTLTWLISSEVLMIEHWYLACMILVTGPFNWHQVVTLTLTFDLLQGQICCRAGDHNSPNLLVVFKVQFCTRIYIFVKRSQDL